ncbi:MAG: GTPase [Calditrichaeota bacterium]|nr:GTPase [Calditrichota bacterium]
MKPRRVLIMGAAGRDFHNFNVLFRDNPDVEVVAFTATQIPNIDGRIYPAELAGSRYPNGIPIFNEIDIADIITRENIDGILFAYSDISYQALMNKSAEVMAAGASFMLLGPNATMLPSNKPVIAVTAVRTGCGKSQTTRRVGAILRQAGKKVAVVRHPMPYGNLVKQRVQRFAALDDLRLHNCTIEEMEEYEPHIINGMTVYAGVDYAAILRQVEQEADIILWDGGNNDLPFFKPDMQITVVDPLRPGHELSYYPGEVNLRRADVVVINKIDSAEPENVEEVRDNVRMVNPRAIIIDAVSPIKVENSALIRTMRVLAVEDGPTVTHGEMTYGAGVVAAHKYGAVDLVDPRPFLTGTLVETFAAYPDIGPVLPAMGYSPQQVADLAETINNSDADVVIIGTPVDLRRIVDIRKPTVRVTYELQEIGSPTLADALAVFL